jgi:uncharacterized protein (TIGR03118 family)
LGDPADDRVNRYIQTNLVSNKRAFRPQLLDLLVHNAWGIALRPAGLGGHFWVANQASASVTTYVGDVEGVPLFQDDLKFVGVDGAPIGQVFSGSPTDFPVAGALCTDQSLDDCDSTATSYLGELTGPARFIVNTEEGQIAAWTEGTINGQFGRMRRFVTVVDNSAEGALSRGLAVTDRASGNRLYAAHFSGDRIEVYDSQWRRIGGPFHKPKEVPDTYRPFNIQYLDGHLFVAYAELMQPGDPDFDAADPLAEGACAGCGFVAVFDEHGVHVKTLEGRKRLNAPWGLAIAPADFGPFSNALLVGNFGDGTIVAFDLATGRQIDYLRGNNGKPVKIDGLWALTFGNGVSLGRANSLYFTAGPHEEVDGLFGSLHAKTP